MSVYINTEDDRYFDFKKSDLGLYRFRTKKMCFYKYNSKK